MTAGLPGRPNIPTSIHEARGTRRSDRERPNEPQPPALEVGSKPPEWIRGVRRRRAWTELGELLRDHRVLTVMDAAALALLVDAYGDYLEASDLIGGRACGHCGRPIADKRACTAEAIFGAHEPGDRYYTTRTKEGSLMIRPHPAVTVRQDAWKRVVGMLAQFGMTPAARARVAAAADPADVDPMEAFFRGRRG